MSSASYTARHRPDPAGARDAHGRRIIADPVGPDYSPLAPAIRQALAQHHWASRVLPAGPDDLTGRLDPAAVLAAAAADDDTAVLRRLRADLDTDPHGIHPSNTREEQA